MAHGGSAGGPHGGGEHNWGHGDSGGKGSQDHVHHRAYSDDNGAGNGVNYHSNTIGVAHHGLIGLNVEHDLINMSLASGVAMAIALEAVGLAGHHGEGLHDYHVGYLRDIIPGAQHFVGDPQNADPGRHFNISGIKNIDYGKRKNDPPDLRFVECQVWPHGECDAVEILHRSMLQRGMRQIHIKQAAGLCDMPIDGLPWEIVEKITSNLPFTNRGHATNMPDGWFKDCKGRTYITRRFYQLRPPWWMPKSVATYEDWKAYRTMIVSALVTFEFYVKWKGDLVKYRNTRLQNLVWSPPLMAGAPGYKWEEIRQHRKVAELSCRDVFAFLSSYPADPYAIRALAAMPLDRFEPPKPKHMKTPAPVTTGVTTVPPRIGPDTDEEDARRARIEAEDQNDPDRDAGRHLPGISHSRG